MEGRVLDVREIEVNGVDKVGDVNLDLNEDVEHFSQSVGDGNKAGMAVMHQ